MQNKYQLFGYRPHTNINDNTASLQPSIFNTASIIEETHESETNSFYDGQNVISVGTVYDIW